MDIFLGSSKAISKNIKEKFLKNADLGEYTVETPSDYLYVINQKKGESLIISTDRLEIIFDGYISGLLGLELEANILQITKIVVANKTLDYSNYNGLFNLCIREKLSGNIWLISDPSALLPLYYATINGTFYYCSHKHIMGSALNTTPDYAGICQKIAFGYSLGSRTYYEGISQINPGETIRYEAEKNRLHSSYNQIYYTNEFSNSISEAEIYSNLLGSFEKMRMNYSKIGLMLSEGFDSRFMGGVAKHSGFQIKSFTHGINDAGGQKIAEQVAYSLSSNHYFCDLTDGFPIKIDKLKQQLLLSDNLNIPFWIYGSEYFLQENADFPIIIGTALDTTLGGHAFYKPLRPYARAIKQRYSEILGQNFGLITNKYLEHLSRDLLKNIFLSDLKPLIKSIYHTFNSDVAGLICSKIDDLNSQLKEELERIERTGSKLPSQILQRYFLEHRARKFSFGQELTIRMYNKIFIPSYEYGFINLAGAINPICKLHHQLYLRILRKYTPELLKIPNGGYGIPALYPRVVLESSRFINKKLEKGRFRKLLESHGELSPSNFRSAFVTDYCLRDETKIQEFEALVEKNKTVYNSKEMHNYFQLVKNYKVRTFIHEKFYRTLEVSQVINKKI